jgi:hypothetical protein
MNPGQNYPIGGYNPYPNINTNYNPGICNLCRGAGSYISNGVNVPCQCQPSVGFSSANFNAYTPYGQTNYPQEHIYNDTNYHPHHKNIFEKAWDGVKGVFTSCKKCKGEGFQSNYTKSGHPKVCYECIRASGYCPVCQNTGYKIHNGKRCKCDLY